MDVVQFLSLHLTCAKIQNNTSIQQPSAMAIDILKEVLNSCSRIDALNLISWVF